MPASKARRRRRRNRSRRAQIQRSIERATEAGDVKRVALLMEEKRRLLAGDDTVPFEGRTSKGVQHPGSHEVDTRWHDHAKRCQDEDE